MEAVHYTGQDVDVVSDSEPYDPTVTIPHAMKELELSRTMVYNLMKANKLKGPEFEERPPRNGGRIYLSSLREYQAERAAGGASAGRRGRKKRPPASDEELFERLQQVSAAARADMRAHRQKSRRIAKKLVDLVVLEAQIAQEQAEAVQHHANTLAQVREAFNDLDDLGDRENETIDRLLDGYRDILSSLVTSHRQPPEAATPS